MKKNRRIITMTSDFGNKDSYAAEVKGTILKYCPDCTIVEISNRINAYDIEQAGYVLKKAYLSFPQKTIHLYSVDPDVGSSEKSIITEVNERIFVGPDNGLISPIVKNQDYKAFIINTEPFITANTFHARDILAPIAGQLAAGYPLPTLSKPIKTIEQFDLAQPVFHEQTNQLSGKVIIIDRFGNIETNIDTEQIHRFENPIVKINNEIIGNRYQYFKDIPPNQYGLIVNCYGYLAIVKNRQSAAQSLQATEKMEVTVLERNAAM